MSKVKEQAAAHKAMKEEAMATVRKQREKALIARRTGRPTAEEDRAEMKALIEKPVNHRKEAIKLFEQVISANADKVFKKLLQKASDDDDKDQMAALKLIADRLAPMTSFTEGGAGGSGAGKVVINISGLHDNGNGVNVQGRVIDAEDVE
jgi:hypothetical protein